MMTAELISMGTIYLMGMLEEPVQTYLAGRMTELGIDIRRRQVVSDELEDVTAALKEAFQRVETVILTGGSRPSFPTIRDSLFVLFGTSDKERGLEAQNDYRIPSRTGNTEGFILRKDEHILIVLPGTAEEVEDMFEDDVVGYLLKDVAEGKASLVMELNPETVGMLGISYEELTREMLEKKLAPILSGDNPTVQITEEKDMYKILIHAVGPTENDAKILVQMMAGDISRRLGNVTE